MTRGQAAKLVAFMAAHYPTTRLDRVVLAAWEARLAGYPSAPAVKAALRVTGRRGRSGGGLPPLGELIEEIELVVADMPDADEAWVEAAQWLRSGTPHGTRPSAAIREAINLAGGSWGYQHCDDPAGFRWSFASAYKGLRQARIRKVREELPEMAAAELAQLREGRPEILELPKWEPPQ